MVTGLLRFHFDKLKSLSGEFVRQPSARPHVRNVMWTPGNVSVWMDNDRQSYASGSTMDDLLSIRDRR